MWEDFGPLLPQIWSNVAEILTIGSTLGSKNIKQNLKDSSFHKKEMDQKFAKFTTSFSLRMPKIEKDKHKWGKTSAIWLSKYVKIKTLSPLPFPEKNTITICNISAIFARKQGRVTNQRVRIKIWQNFADLFKHFGSNVFLFFSYRQQRNQGHFRINLTWYSSLAAFLGIVPFLKNMSYLIQNLMLNRLAPV